MCLLSRSDIITGWVGNITYIPTDEGWLYLAVVIDLYNCKVEGWSMSDRIKKSLVISAQRMAVAESFFKSLKSELVDWRHYKTRDEARRDIFQYIKMFYNR